MRRFIIATIGSFFVLALMAAPSWAQLRRVQRPMPAGPARPMNFFQSPFGFSNTFASPTLVRTASGNYNPSTGAFTPTAGGGSYQLFTRRPFEPVSGTFVPSNTGRYVLAAQQTFNPATNTFVPSPTGNIVARTRGDFVPAPGAFVRSSAGSYNPQTGVFSPGTNGAYTLSSRGNFVPTSGTFVPTAGGFFVLSTKEAFNPATGAYVPSATGTFNVLTRGSFVPSAGILPASTTTTTTGNPASPIRLSNNQMRLLSYFNSPYNSYWTQFGSYASGVANPYLTTGYNPYSNGYWNPYAYANPYLYGYTNPYGYANPYAYANSYGGGYGYGNPYAAQSQYAAPGANYAATQPNADIPDYTPTNAKSQPATTAYGIPNVDGAVQWPFAFRMMSAEQKRTLLDPLEGQLQIIAKQAAEGKANPALAKETRQSVDQLFKWLRSRRLDMAEGSFQEARQFLERLDGRLDTMRKASDY